MVENVGFPNRSSDCVVIFETPEEAKDGHPTLLPEATAVYECQGLVLNGDVRLGFYHTGLAGMCCGEDIKLGGTVFLNMRHIPDNGVVLLRNRFIDGAEKEKVPKGIELRIEFAPLEDVAAEAAPAGVEATVGAMVVEEPVEEPDASGTV